MIWAIRHGYSLALVLVGKMEGESDIPHWFNSVWQTRGQGRSVVRLRLECCSRTADDWPMRSWFLRCQDEVRVRSTPPSGVTDRRIGPRHCGWNGSRGPCRHRRAFLNDA